MSNFNNLALKPEFITDYKVKRAIQKFEVLRKMVEKDCEDTLISSLPPIVRDEPREEVKDFEPVQRQLLQTRSSDSAPEMMDSIIISEIDYDIEGEEKKNYNLTKAVSISSEGSELNTQIAEKLGQHRDMLNVANREAFKAAAESNKALKEVKIKAKDKWSWLPFQSIFAGGGTGAVGGGVAATLPGAAIGGVAGGVAGYKVGKVIKRAASKRIDIIKGQTPIMIDE